MMRKMMFAGAALALGATPALAQVDLSQGLVDVTVQNVSVLNNFLNKDQITALSNLELPITVQVPVGVAAAVCGIDANVIAKQKKGNSDYSCEATSGSQALAHQVMKQKLNQNRWSASVTDRSPVGVPSAGLFAARDSSRLRPRV